MRKKCTYINIIFFIIILYLVADILSDNRTFSRISKNIVQDENDPVRKAILINNWTHKSIKLADYKMPNILKTPRFILRKDGVCGSFSKICAVLMREQRIPARLLYIYYKDAPVHIITEAYLKGKWRVFDPYFGYIYFGEDSLPATANDIMQNPDIMKRVINPEIYPKTHILKDVRRTNWTKIPGGKLLHKFLKGKIGKKADYISINVITLRPKILYLIAFVILLVLIDIICYIKIYHNKIKKL